MPYTKTTFVNGAAPAISAAELNKIGDGIATAQATAEAAAPATHTHAASAIISGTIATARLGSGTANSGTVLYGDGTWKTAPSGGSGTPADATATTKGVVQLAGDLGGTAAAPTVPGLAGKANTSHTHSASDISTGTLGIARIPTGTSSSTVALGNHTHTPASIGAAPASHTHGAADLSGVVKTVNGTAPDGSGNVVVSGGGGSVSPAPPVLFYSSAAVGANFWSQLAPPGVAVISGGTGSADRVGLALVTLPASTLTRLGINVITAGAAGSVARIGIYSMASNGGVGTLALDSGSLDTSTGGVKSATVSQSLAAGAYWVAVGLSDSATRIDSWEGVSAVNGATAAIRSTSGTSWSTGMPSTLTIGVANSSPTKTPIVYAQGNLT